MMGHIGTKEFNLLEFNLLDVCCAAADLEINFSGFIYIYDFQNIKEKRCQWVWNPVFWGVKGFRVTNSAAVSFGILIQFYLFDHICGVR